MTPNLQPMSDASQRPHASRLLTRPRVLPPTTALPLRLPPLHFALFSPLAPFRVQVVHSLKAGVVEPAMSKVKSLRFACEAAITILRIDDFIKIDKQERGR